MIIYHRIADHTGPLADCWQQKKKKRRSLANQPLCVRWIYEMGNRQSTPRQLLWRTSFFFFQILCYTFAISFSDYLLRETAQTPCRETREKNLNLLDLLSANEITVEERDRKKSSGSGQKRMERSNNCRGRRNSVACWVFSPKRNWAAVRVTCRRAITATVQRSPRVSARRTRARSVCIPSGQEIKDRSSHKPFLIQKGHKRRNASIPPVKNGIDHCRYRGDWCLMAFTSASPAYNENPSRLNSSASFLNNFPFISEWNEGVRR